MRHDLLFETERFNISEAGAHFINPNCFGEDLAAWLRGKLAARGVEAGEPDQEDWGWYLDATYKGRMYLVGVGGNPADEPEAAGRRTGRNRAEWRIMIEPHRSVWDRLKNVGRGAPQASADEELAHLVRDILAGEPDFHNIHAE